MAWLRRFLPLLAVWVVLTGADTSSVLVGIATAGGAALLGLRLLPPVPGRLGAVATLRLVVDFVQGSIAGGIDVAGRAFHPRMPLHPGWVRLPLHIPPGSRRMWLGDYLSLMPGTLAAGDDRQGLLVHCLDTGSDVASGLARHEARLQEMFEEPQGPRDG